MHSWFVFAAVGCHSLNGTGRAWDSNSSVDGARDYEEAVIKTCTARKRGNTLLQPPINVCQK